MNFNNRIIKTLIKFLKNLLLVLISILISIFFSEIIFRKIKININSQNVMNLNDGKLLIQSDNTRLLYTYNKNIQGVTNLYGFHDKEYALEKNPDKIRILALGDSVAYGVGNELTIDQNFLAMLEDDYENIEIINLAHSGYNTMQEVEHFKIYGLQFKPDILWVFYVLNDPENDSMELFVLGKDNMNFRNKLKEMTFLGWLDQNCFVWKYFSNKFINISLDNKIKSKINKDAENKINNIKYKNLYQYMHQDKYYKSVINEFKILKKLSVENNFKLTVFIVPELIPYKKYQNISIHKKISDSLKKIDINVVDLMSIIKNNDPYKIRLNSIDNLHLNIKGHIIFKDYLKPILESEIKNLNK